MLDFQPQTLDTDLAHQSVNAIPKATVYATIIDIYHGLEIHLFSRQRVNWQIPDIFLIPVCYKEVTGAQDGLVAAI
jgi:hypothetical protein